MRHARQAQPCEVVWNGIAPLSIRLGGERVVVTEVLESWAFRGHWWLEPSLLGQRRRYWHVVTERGLYELRALIDLEGAPTWAVVGVWD